MIKIARLFFNKIKLLFINKNDLELKEYYKLLKTKNKSDLIREIVLLSQQINNNDSGISSTYKKKLRRETKKNLINTLILLKLHEYKPIKKLRNKVHAKAKRERKPK